MADLFPGLSGAALDARIAELEADVKRLRGLLNNGWLVVNDPANAFVAVEPWSLLVERELGSIHGCMRVPRGRDTTPQREEHDVTTKSEIAAGICDDGMSAFVPGVNCLDCGRFVGRDGYIGIEHFEMSSQVASVEGQCRRCIDAEHDREVDAERRHLTDLVT